MQLQSHNTWAPINSSYRYEIVEWFTQIFKRMDIFTDFKNILHTWWTEPILDDRYRSWANRSVLVGYSSLAHCWASLVAPVGFGMSRRFCLMLLGCMPHMPTYSQGACVLQSMSIRCAVGEHRDPKGWWIVPSQYIVSLLFICTVYICAHSRILALLTNVYRLSYDFK